MENSEIINVGFKIISTNSENNSVTIRPMSTNFKKEEDSYPALNICIANLNPNKDIKEQIVELLQPTVKAIIDSENDEFIKKFNQFIETNQNKTISMDKAINPIPQTTTHQSDVIFSTDSFEVIT